MHENGEKVARATTSDIILVIRVASFVNNQERPGFDLPCSGDGPKDFAVKRSRARRLAVLSRPTDDATETKYAQGLCPLSRLIDLQD